MEEKQYDQENAEQNHSNYGKDYDRLVPLTPILIPFVQFRRVAPLPVEVSFADKFPSPGEQLSAADAAFQYAYVSE